MNNKRRNRILAAVGIVAILVFALGAYLLREQSSCCAPVGDYFTATAIVASNQTTEAQIHQTETYAFAGGFVLTVTPTPNPFPYDPTLYAQRRHQDDLLKTGAGPTQYAIFFATETALVATFQGTVLPTFTPIPYTADMSPTAIPLPSRTPTASPTLCPPSDVVCPGGNATMSPGQEVMVLMASAKAPEFGQLAQTATALAGSPSPTMNVPQTQTAQVLKLIPTDDFYANLMQTATALVQITSTPEPSSHDSNCAFMWAHRDLPEAAVAAQTAFTNAGVDSIGVIRAEAYGENCMTSDGKLSYFAAMTSDFYLTATVTHLDDTNEIAQIVKTAYNTITTLKVKLPASPGYLDILMNADGSSKHFRAMFSQLRPLIEAGNAGAELLATGGF